MNTMKPSRWVVFLNRALLIYLTAYWIYTIDKLSWIHLPVFIINAVTLIYIYWNEDVFWKKYIMPLAQYAHRRWGWPRLGAIIQRSIEQLATFGYPLETIRPWRGRYDVCFRVGEINARTTIDAEGRVLSSSPRCILGPKNHTLTSLAAIYSNPDKYEIQQVPDVAFRTAQAMVRAHYAQLGEAYFERLRQTMIEDGLDQATQERILRDARMLLED